MSRALVLAMCVLGIGALTADSLAIPARSNASVTVARVISTPHGKGQFVRGRVNVVPAYRNLAFRVTLRNGTGRRNVSVTLTIDRPHSTLGPIVKRTTTTLGSNRTSTLVFRKLGQVYFAQRESF